MLDFNRCRPKYDELLYSCGFVCLSETVGQKTATSVPAEEPIWVVQRKGGRMIPPFLFAQQFQDCLSCTFQLFTSIFRGDRLLFYCTNWRLESTTTVREVCVFTWILSLMSVVLTWSFKGFSHQDGDTFSQPVKMFTWSHHPDVFTLDWVGRTRPGTGFLSDWEIKEDSWPTCVQTFGSVISTRKIPF